ncbi:hypothetical protein BGZ98_002415, partial [Dissophora globulifera]
MDKITHFVQKSDCNAIAVAIFGVIGAGFVAFKALSLLKVLVDVFLRSGTNFKKYGAGRGGWASKETKNELIDGAWLIHTGYRALIIVTGATDGIGKEFALQLASKKMNLVLVSRTESKLKAIAKELEEKYSVQTKYYAMDFTKGSDADYQGLQQVLNSCEVNVL